MRGFDGLPAGGGAAAGRPGAEPSGIDVLLAGPPGVRVAENGDRRTPGGAPSQWRAGGRGLLALLRRDLTERRGLRLSFLLDLLFGLLNLLVFLFVSRVLTPVPAGGLERAASYFDFVAVGIVFLLVLQAATLQVVARVVTEQRDGTLELLAAQPVPAWSVGLGLAGYPFAFALVRAALYLAVLAGFFGLHVGHADWPGVAVMLALTALCTLPFCVLLMGIGVAVGYGDPAARLLVVALSFLSGTYFPPSVLPHVLHPVCAVLPTRIALDGLRHALGGGGWRGAAAVLAGITAVLLPLSAWIFDRALWLGRRRGVLTRD
ncbi:ABC transporter permease [Micromonospora sp. R77]|uniref:ABC transporter permease n=1 Tax=Micromonospora sp. R77 TaxID=2925836 RepID=UPI001F6054C1|nr:ABC transporter permease [Micromonospora sp. R77]MCI4061283.1 ABC transporter permease [Micromonospora sp. R77]